MANLVFPIFLVLEICDRIRVGFIVAWQSVKALMEWKKIVKCASTEAEYFALWRNPVRPVKRLHFAFISSDSGVDHEKILLEAIEQQREEKGLKNLMYARSVVEKYGKDQRHYKMAELKGTDDLPSQSLLNHYAAKKY